MTHEELTKLKSDRDTAYASKNWKEFVRLHRLILDEVFGDSPVVPPFLSTTHPQDEIALDPSAGTAITDTQMLDWMQSKRALEYTVDIFGSEGWRLRNINGSQKLQYPTLRAAITAAMTGADPCL